MLINKKIDQALQGEQFVVERVNSVCDTPDGLPVQQATGFESIQFDGDQLADACCKVCKKGKACGNSCIAKSKTCHKGKGCACNG